MKTTALIGGHKQSMDESVRVGVKHKRRTGWILALLVLIIFGLLAACGYLFLQYERLHSQQDTAGQATELVAKLSHTIELPNEQPSIATVLDRTKLGDQQLADEARNGDTLLVYSKARRVVLYRPSTGRVIDMFHVEAKQASGSNAVKSTTR